MGKVIMTQFFTLYLLVLDLNASERGVALSCAKSMMACNNIAVSPQVYSCNKA